MTKEMWKRCDIASFLLNEFKGFLHPAGPSLQMQYSSKPLVDECNRSQVMQRVLLDHSRVIDALPLGGCFERVYTLRSWII